MSSRRSSRPSSKRLLHVDEDVEHDTSDDSHLVHLDVDEANTIHLDTFSMSPSSSASKRQRSRSRGPPTFVPSVRRSRRSRASSRPVSTRSRAGTAVSLNNESKAEESVLMTASKRRFLQFFLLFCFLFCAVTIIVIITLLVLLLPLLSASVTLEESSVSLGDLCLGESVPASARLKLRNAAGLSVVLEPATVTISRDDTAEIVTTIRVTEPVDVPFGDDAFVVTDGLLFDFPSDAEQFARLLDDILDDVALNLTMAASLTINFAGIPISSDFEFPISLNEEQAERATASSSSSFFNLESISPGIDSPEEFALSVLFAVNSTIPAIVIDSQRLPLSFFVFGSSSCGTDEQELLASAIVPINEPIKPGFNEGLFANVTLGSQFAPLVGNAVADFALRSCNISLSLRGRPSLGSEDCWLQAMLSHLNIDVPPLSSNSRASDETEASTSSFLPKIEELEILNDQDGTLSLMAYVNQSTDALLVGVWPEVSLAMQLPESPSSLVELRVRNFRFDILSRHSFNIDLLIKSPEQLMNEVNRIISSSEQRSSLRIVGGELRDGSPSTLQRIIFNMGVFFDFAIEEERVDEYDSSKSTSLPFFIDDLHLISMDRDSAQLTTAVRLDFGFGPESALFSESLFIRGAATASFIVSDGTASSSSALCSLHGDARLDVESSLSISLSLSDTEVGNMARFVSNLIELQSFEVSLVGQSDGVDASSPLVSQLLAYFRLTVASDFNADGAADSTRSAQAPITLGTIGIDSVENTRVDMSLSFSLTIDFVIQPFLWNVVDQTRAVSLGVLSLSEISAQSALRARLDLRQIDAQNVARFVEDVLDGDRLVVLELDSRSSSISGGGGELVIERVIDQLNLEFKVVDPSSSSTVMGDASAGQLSLQELKVLSAGTAARSVDLAAVFLTSNGLLAASAIPSVSMDLFHRVNDASASTLLARVVSESFALVSGERESEVVFSVILEASEEATVNLVNEALDGAVIHFEISGPTFPESVSSPDTVLQRVVNYLDYPLGTWDTPKSPASLSGSTQSLSEKINEFLQVEILSSNRTFVQTEVRVSLTPSLAFRVSFGNLAGSAVYAGETLLTANAPQLSLRPGDQEIRGFAQLVGRRASVEAAVDDFLSGSLDLVFFGQIEGERGTDPLQIRFPFSLRDDDSFSSDPGASSSTDLAALIPCVSSPEFAVLGSVFNVISSGGRCSLDLSIELFVRNPLPLSLVLDRAAGFVATSSPGVPIFYPTAKNNITFGSVDQSLSLLIRGGEVKPAIVSLGPAGGIEECARITHSYLTQDEIDLNLYSWELEILVGQFPVTTRFDAEITIPLTDEGVSGDDISCEDQLGL